MHSDKALLARTLAWGHNYRYQALATVGVVGAAMSLIAGIDRLLPMVDWARSAIVYWRTLSQAVWSWLFGWIGISIPAPIAVMINFAIFGLLLALGVRLRTRYLAGNNPTDKDELNSVRGWRVLAGFLVMALLIPFLLVYFDAYKIDFPPAFVNRLPTVSFALFLLILVGVPLLLSAAFFLWAHGASRRAAQIFLLSLPYAVFAFLMPLRESIHCENCGDSGVEYLDAAPFVSLGLINLVFSLMLAIAPPKALRNRLISSLLVSSLFIAANALYKSGWLAVS